MGEIEGPEGTGEGPPEKTGHSRTLQPVTPVGSFAVPVYSTERKVGAGLNCPPFSLSNGDNDPNHRHAHDGDDLHKDDEGQGRT